MDVSTIVGLFAAGETADTVTAEYALTQQQYALHRHLYDLIGVYSTDGDRMIVSTDGTRRPVSTKAWDTAYQLRGVTHIEEGASDSPLDAVFVELKEDAPRAAKASSCATTSGPRCGSSCLRRRQAPRIATSATR